MRVVALRALPAQPRGAPGIGAAPRAAPRAHRPARSALRVAVCSSSRALSAAVAEKAASVPQAAPRFAATIPRGETGGAALVVEDVSIQAGDRDLLTDAAMRIMPGQRVGLVGTCDARFQGHGGPTLSTAARLSPSPAASRSTY